MRHVLATLICVLILTSCATHSGQKIVPTPIIQAQQEVPEEQLLDVGITAFESAELTEEKAKEEGTNPEIRKAETHFVAYHLKNTLQQSSQWGAVRVVPASTDESEMKVTGEILESNGENLIVRIDVSDARGNTWLQKTYKAEATPQFFTGNVPGEKDPFQDLYNTIANDMALHKNQLDPAEIERLRMIARLRFAQGFSPEAFGDYMVKDKRGKFKIKRLPADDDPMMARLLKIRDREYMYVDTLNEYYDEFYNDMWQAYENWRKLSQQEIAARREIKRSAILKQIGGALMLALAIGLDAGGVPGTNALQNILIIGGGAVIIDGINVSKEAEIHSAAIEELSESFGNEMKPVVMEFQGRQYELTGSAEEQYTRWRELLREIYFTETGFGPDASIEETEPDSAGEEVIEKEPGVRSQEPE
ncbi:MAG: hypothetical protein JSU72_09275 [Deltaproteobacteria bacterium]|nr:MAG: hypothetical protein JSU72_09275 [Deltaproteobacteria bacterium]